LGTFCIMDRKARHNELTSDELASLHDFSEMCVKAMVDRRYRLQRQDNPAQLIASTAHDLMTPLTGVQLSLSLLKGDDEVQSKLSHQQRQLLTTASTCSELMFRMAQTTVETLRQGSAPLSSSMAQQTPDNMQTPAVTDTIQITKLAELVKSLIAIMDPIPKRVPLIITLDPSGPPAIIGDDLKLFRSALNLVSHAIGRTELGWVHLRIYPKTDSIEDENQSHLVFECEDTGSKIEVEEYQYLFQPSRKTEENNIRLGLSSVASLINSLDGEYGFRPRTPVSDPKGRQRLGANFWFSVPLFIPETSCKASSATAGNFERNGSSHSMSRYPSIPVLHRPSSGSRLQINGSNGSLSSSLSSSLSRHLSSESIGDRRNIFWDQNAAQKIAAAVAPSSGKKSAWELDCNKNMFTKPKQNEQNTSEVAAGSADTKSAPSIASRPRRRRALVIDDSLVVRKSLAMALKRKLGYSVVLAVDGLDGLNKLKEIPFDICLCDFLMPVMDGMDCVKQFREWERENRPWDRQPIVGISAHASANDGGRGIKAGMDDFKPKPITIKTLIEVHESDSVTARAKILNELEEYFGQQTQLVTNICKKAPPNAVAEVPTEVEQAMKLKRARSRSKNHVSNEKVCLIATNSPIIKSNELLTKLKGSGWKVVVVHDGEEALRSLQTRNWDVVLIDDDIPVLVGTPFITTFRRWEGQDRINRQRNIFLLVDGDIPAPSDKASTVQPPSGLDGVLRKPVDWDHLQYMIQKGPKAGSLEIIVK